MLHHQQQERQERRKKEGSDLTKEPQPDLTPVQFACRRLVDSLEECPELWKLAADCGIPWVIGQTTYPAWYNHRQASFTRKKQKTQGSERYGGLQVLYDHGRAAGWKDMLQHLVSSGVAYKATIDGKDFARLRFCGDGIDSLRAWQVFDKAVDKYLDTNWTPILTEA